MAVKQLSLALSLFKNRIPAARETQLIIQHGDSDMQDRQLAKQTAHRRRRHAVHHRQVLAQHTHNFLITKPPDGTR